MVVLDTSTVIDYLDGDEATVEAVDRHLGGSGAAITFITEYELLKYDGADAGRMGELISSMHIYHSSDRAALAAAATYRDLRRRGKMINENDILLFGICMANGETLLTGDADFERIGSNDIVVIR